MTASRIKIDKAAFTHQKLIKHGLFSKFQIEEALKLMNKILSQKYRYKKVHIPCMQKIHTSLLILNGTPDRFVLHSYMGNQSNLMLT